MPNETIVLDPSEVATSTRSSLDINSGAIQVRQEGVDWGTAEIQATMAQQTPGESVVDYKVPNRTITIPLVMQTSGTVTFTSARDQLGTKVAELQSSGGWLKRVTAQGGTYFADIVSASVQIPGGWLQRARDVENEAVLTLQALPDFYGAEATLSDHTETSAAEITFTETTAAGGDFPLGDRVRVVIDEDDADSQRGLFWSFRARHYQSASTAQSALEAESLITLDTATRVAKTGASGGTMVTHGTLLSGAWTPVLNTGINYGGTVWLTHTGTNRIYGRVFSTSGTLVQTRLTWDVGDLVYPVENPPRRLYDGGTFHIIDYGEVRLDRTATGTHRWGGQIEAKGDVGGESFSIDKLWVVNQDESAGLITTPPEALASSPSSFVARDNFTQGTANLNTLTAQVGGAWDTSETSFDATDFTVSGSTAFMVARAEVSDAANAGRPALLGSSVSACGVQADMKFSVTVTGLRLGVLARYTDISNYLLAAMNPTTDPNLPSIVVTKRVAGSTTTLGQSGFSSYLGLTGTWYSLRLTVDAAGNWTLWAALASPTGQIIASGQDSALASGGALASGRVGFYDENTTATVSVRNYDNFQTWAPEANAVMFASQSMELATTGITREDSTGTAWVAVPGPYGDLPRMPNRSSAGTVEFMAKASRGDMQTLSDPAMDDISARIYRRPSYLTPD